MSTTIIGEEGWPGVPGLTDRAEGLRRELERLRAENRRLAISLGGFSAFMASRGMLEEAWDYVHGIHLMDEGGAES